MENYLMLHGQKIELTEEQIEKIRLSHGFCLPYKGCSICPYFVNVKEGANNG